MRSATLLCSVIDWKVPQEKDDLELDTDLSLKELTAVSPFLKEDLNHTSLCLPLPGSYPELTFW